MVGFLVRVRMSDVMVVIGMVFIFLKEVFVVRFFFFDVVSFIDIVNVNWLFNNVDFENVFFVFFVFKILLFVIVFLLIVYDGNVVNFIICVIVINYLKIF